MGCAHSHSTPNPYDDEANNPYINRPPPFTEDVAALPPQYQNRKAENATNRPKMTRMQNYRSRHEEWLDSTASGDLGTRPAIGVAF